MAKFVPDINTQRWVVIAPGRVARPAESTDAKTEVAKPKVCPFCTGNEELTPPEVWRIGGEGEWNKPGWKVRVVPNKFEITDIHEVIIHSPEHDKDIENLPIDQVKLIFRVYRDRYSFNEKNGQVIIFCNHGVHAGASLGHPHSQLVVLPRQINLDALSREPLNNLIKENTFFTVFCPDFSQWPYEVWIAPKAKKEQAGIFKTTSFSEVSDEELSDLSEITQQIIQKLKKISELTKIKKMNIDEDFSYNYYIYPGRGWYLRIIPRFIHRAGFELGTGLSVNIVDPKDAAEELKAISF